jgi:DNA invertase Pin-like site-specific DNA recombinase
MKSIIYTRISSSGQKDGVSLDAQLDECRTALLNNQIKEFVLVQEVHSAYSIVPPLLEVLAKKRAHRIVFYAVDRFSRNVISGMQCAMTMLKNKCELVFIREHLVITATEGRAWARFIELIAQGERESDTISARVKSSISYLKRAGYHASGHVPFGFNVVQDEIKPNRRRLIENTVETTILEFIDLCRTPGTSVKSINAKLGIVNDPIVLEWTDKGKTVALKTLKYAMDYDDIAYFLNQYTAVTYKGNPWKYTNVATAYKNYKGKDEDNVEDIVEDIVEQFNMFNPYDENKHMSPESPAESSDDEVSYDDDPMDGSSSSYSPASTRYTYTRPARITRSLSKQQKRK